MHDAESIAPSGLADDPKRASALVVEDDHAIRLAVAEILQSDDYTTVSVGRIDEARVALRHVHPSIIVLDLVLEGENGRELLAELADRDDAPPMVLVSGAVDAQSVAEEFHVPLVKKPFELVDLLAAVNRARTDDCRPRR